MSSNIPFEFKGHGTAPKSPGEVPLSSRDELREAENHLTPPDLVAAVNVALTLGMPLLVTGDAGSGKSSVAARLHYELRLNGDVLAYTVKSDTKARDLFYQFDTLGRFHAANTPDPTDPDAADPRRFIRFKALGLALLHAIGPERVRQLLGPYGDQYAINAPSRRVVLIDEIDKAPRDVPNDILMEIDQMRLEVPELAGSRTDDGTSAGIPVIELTTEDAKYRPIVIFTSNSERALPEPFIRRCAYHHLKLPEYHLPDDQDVGQVSIEAIVAKRIGTRYTQTDVLKEAVEFFQTLRESGAPRITRKPSLAELLDWLEGLCSDYGAPGAAPLSLKKVAFLDRSGLENTVKTLLLKNREDHENGLILLKRQLGLDDAR